MNQSSTHTNALNAGRKADKQAKVAFTEREKSRDIIELARPQ